MIYALNLKDRKNHYQNNLTFIQKKKIIIYRSDNPN